MFKKAAEYIVLHIQSVEMFWYSWLNLSNYNCYKDVYFKYSQTLVHEKSVFLYGFLNWQYKINRYHKTMGIKIIDASIFVVKWFKGLR